MGYVLNVALNGRHLFATAQRSLSNIAETKKLLRFFLIRFTEDEGFTISVMKWRETGTHYLAEEFLEL